MNKRIYLNETANLQQNDHLNNFKRATHIVLQPACVHTWLTYQAQNRPDSATAVQNIKQHVSLITLITNF